jgi:hypothetical protein
MFRVAAVARRRPVTKGVVMAKIWAALVVLAVEVIVVVVLLATDVWTWVGL